jgi:hypothetical protein
MVCLFLGPGSAEQREGRCTASGTQTLTETCLGLIAARMINVATNFLARRRRISAVWADVCA